MGSLEEIVLQQFAFADIDDDDTTFTASEMWYHCEIDVCLSGDCVDDTKVGACSTFSNTPAPAAGRRRRAILSQKVRREAPVNDCEVQEVDGNLVTCKQQREALSSAETFGFSVLT